MDLRSPHQYTQVSIGIQLYPSLPSARVLAAATAGFSQAIGMLIVCRAAQGIGAGGLIALATVLIADIFTPRERGRYMGLMGGIMVVAQVGGPLIGGLITDSFLGWRWDFSNYMTASR